MRILVLGDTHLPFTNWAALRAASRFAKSYNPNIVVQVGDFLDAYNWSRYQRAQDSPSAEAEWNEAVLSAHRFFDYFPYKTTILFGNHDARPAHKAMEANLPKALIKSLDEVFKADDVTFYKNSHPYTIDEMVFIHGDEMGGNAWQKAQKLGKCLIQGHDHVAYLQYVNTFNRQIFGMSVGAFIDINSIAARYAARNLMKCWTGFATITDGVPQLYPWSGK